MSVREKIEVQARVIQKFPWRMLQVEIENGSKPLVYLSGRMRMNKIKVVEGDIVTVQLSPYDLSRGRVVFRKKQYAKK